MSYYKFKVVGEKKSLKEKIFDFSYGIKVWWDDNKGWAIFVLPVAVGLTSWTVKQGVYGVRELIRTHAEKVAKEMYCYDRSLGHYWKLKRPLSNSEWIKINERKKQGEALADILKSIRVI